MVEGLYRRISNELDSIDLKINSFNINELTGKPLVVWIHHDIDQQMIQWCRNNQFVALVNTFVFVSYWQMHKYISTFNLPSNKCMVLKNATTVSKNRVWVPPTIRKVAYTSTPFRGLDILLDSWENLKLENAELHIWSSLKLYGESYDNGRYDALFNRASSISNVYYRGILPNDQLRKELVNIDYLAYPSTFAETSCLSVIEAMSAGCRVICPSLGALPETTAGYARIYPFQPNYQDHVRIFSNILKEELENPWEDRINLCSEQQSYSASFYDWDNRVEEWKTLIKLISK
jgi:glycosyltransferase involved in cell wall biosynthesis